MDLIQIFYNYYIRGYLRQFRPYAKNIDEVIDKILGGYLTNMLYK